MIDKTSLLAELLCLEAMNTEIRRKFLKAEFYCNFLGGNFTLLPGFWALPKIHLRRQKIAHLNYAGI